MRLARDSMIAAGKVMSEHPRSACSRFYYAAYAAAHAMLMHLGETPDREMGTWSHKTLPDHVRACLARNGRRPEEKRAIALSLNRCKNLRESADYGPGRSVGMAEAQDARKLAGRFVELVERRLA